MEKKENNGMCLSVCAYAVSDLCMAVVDKETGDSITKFIGTGARFETVRAAKEYAKTNITSWL